MYVIPKLDKSPYVVAEYLNGREVRMPLGRLTYEEMQQWVEHIRLRSGRRVAKFDNYVHTDRPSVQVRFGVVRTTLWKALLYMGSGTLSATHPRRLSRRQSKMPRRLWRTTLAQRPLTQ